MSLYQFISNFKIERWIQNGKYTNINFMEYPCMDMGW